MNAALAIHDARGRAGLSQMELAALAGTSQATLSAYENGRKQPSLETFERLLAATGARLTVVSGRRPVIQPSKTEMERVSRQLSVVLDLAAALPTRHDAEVRFPRLPTGVAS